MSPVPVAAAERNPAPRRTAIACPEPEKAQVSEPKADSGSQSREPEAKIIELRPRCTATSKQRGERCKAYPVPGATVCHYHGGAIPAVKAKAEQRLQEQAWAAAAGQLTEDERQLYSGDPVAALEYVIARSHALSARLTRIVDGLADGELRYKGT